MGANVKGARGVKVQANVLKRSMRCAGEAARSADPPWARGTMLRSSKWLKGDRRVEEIVGNEIRLRGFYKGGSTCQWVHSVPGDTERVEGESCKSA